MKLVKDPLEIKVLTKGSRARVMKSGDESRMPHTFEKGDIVTLDRRCTCKEEPPHVRCYRNDEPWDSQYIPFEELQPLGDDE